MNGLEGMLEFLESVNNILNLTAETMLTTTETIDSVDFDNNIATDYLGYFRWIVGDINYQLFTTLLIVSAGVTIWTTTLKGIGFVKDVVKWW